jgi:hypothetical protein
VLLSDNFATLATARGLFLGVGDAARGHLFVTLWTLSSDIHTGNSGDHLVSATRKLLYVSRFVIPGTRRLSNLAQGAVSSVEHDMLLTIERAVPIDIRKRGSKHFPPS